MLPSSSMNLIMTSSTGMMFKGCQDPIDAMVTWYHGTTGLSSQIAGPARWNTVLRHGPVSAKMCQSAAWPVPKCCSTWIKMNRFFLVNQDSAGVFYIEKSDCEDPTRTAFQVAEPSKYGNHSPEAGAQFRFSLKNCSHFLVNTMHSLGEHGELPHFQWIFGWWYHVMHHLVGGLEHGFYFPIQLGMSSSQLTFTPSFFRGARGGWLKPPTRLSLIILTIYE